jgi:hypothetical protein
MCTTSKYRAEQREKVKPCISKMFIFGTHCIPLIFELPMEDILKNYKESESTTTRWDAYRRLIKNIFLDGMVLFPFWKFDKVPKVRKHHHKLEPVKKLMSAYGKIFPKYVAHEQKWFNIDRREKVHPIWNLLSDGREEKWKLLIKVLSWFPFPDNFWTVSRKGGVKSIYSTVRLRLVKL